MKKNIINLRKHFITWIVVANGGEAQIYERLYSHETEYIMTPILPHPMYAKNIVDFELNKPTRVYESATSAHHAVEPKIDIREQIKLEFMTDLAKFVNMATDDIVEKIILIIPPELLPILKSKLTHKVLDMIVKEIPKNLVHLSMKELSAVISE